MSDNPMLDAALAYVDAGFRVFPLNGKKPATEHGFKDAVQTQIGCRSIWGKNPKFNIGIPTQDYVVIDFDIKSGGKESKTKMWADHGPLPKTRVHKTGGGGQHWIYSNPFGVDIRNCTTFAGYPGVDIRANGGYIAAPPSIHPDTGKLYEVADPSEIANVPDWVIDIAGQKIPLPQITTGEEIILTEKNRNATMIRLAGAMRRKGMGYDAILAALKATKCQPPLPDKEIEGIAKSSMRWNPDPLDSLPHTDNADITDTPDMSTDKTDKTPQKLTRLTATDKLTDILLTSHVKNQKGEKEGGTIGGLDKGVKGGGGDVTNNTTPIIPLDSKIDNVIWPYVSRWLSFHVSEKFDLDTVCRHLNITDREQRHSVSKKLSYEVLAGKLKKSVNKRPSEYTLLNKELVRVDWLNAKESNAIDITWPYGHEDGSKFGFDGYVRIYPRDVIMVAGVSNTGKTAFAMNLVADNMDTMLVRLQGNEYEASKFKYRFGKMDWCQPVKDDGTPKFELIERYDDWDEAILPEGLNIIDWLNLDGTGHPFYEIGSIIQGIKNKLTTGIVVICIQKDPWRELGRGGGFTQDLASLYLAIDFLPNKSLALTVKKAKAWQEHNPNNEIYAYDLVDSGTKFHRIRKVRKCGHCYAKGETKNGKCEFCEGLGYVDEN